METLRLRSVSLRVADLNRARAFYVDTLGLDPIENGSDRTLALRAPGGGGGTLITLVETSGARPKPAGAPGLFHLALLVPDRPSLARLLLRLARRQIPLHGLSDHGVSEAIYLADPDGNGVEIYADRPRAGWHDATGRLDMFTAPLDTADLLATVPDARDTGLPAGTTLGHVHLTVGDLAGAETFYRQHLGLDVTTREYPGALFMGANGYHHHIAINTWGRRAGTVAATPVYAGLISLQAAVAGLNGSATFTDPDGLRLELTPL